MIFAIFAVLPLAAIGELSQEVTTTGSVTELST